MTTTAHWRGLKLLAVLCCCSLVPAQVSRLTAADPPCSEKVQTTLSEVGSDVSLTAVCFPNGSAIYNWSSTLTSSQDRVQIEYRCYPDNETLKVQSQPTVEIPVPWSNILEGRRQVNDTWDENTTCIFSGCYRKNFVEVYWIQSTNCTSPPSPTFTTPTITRSLQHTLRPSATQTTVHRSPTIIVSTKVEGRTPTAVTATVEPDTPSAVTESSQLDSGGVTAIAAIAVAVAATVVLSVIATIAGLCFLVHRKKTKGRYRIGPPPYKDDVIEDFEPVVPDSFTSIEEDNMSQHDLLVFTATTNHELETVPQGDVTLPNEDEQSIHMEHRSAEEMAAAVGGEHESSPVEEQEELFPVEVISESVMNSAGYIANDTGILFAQP